MSLWGNKDTKALAGTISVTNGSVDVTGSSTAFTTALKSGETLIIAGVEYHIDSITSNTALKLKTAYAGSTASGLTVTANEQPAYVPTSELSSVYFTDTTEVSAGGDNVVSVAVVQGGSGYVEAPGVLFSGGGGSGAAATATISGGSVTSIAVTNTGSSYEEVPTVNIEVPRLTIATSGVNTSTETITYTGHGLSAGEAVKYYSNGGTALAGLTNATTYYAGQVGANSFKLYNSAHRGATAVTTMTVVAAAVNTTTNVINANSHGLVDGAELNYSSQGDTAIAGLTSGNDYFVTVVDADHFTLSATVDGDVIDLTGQGNDGQTFASTGMINLTGTGNNAQYFDKTDKVTATATAAKGSGDTGTQITHSGWVKRTVGTGGRAGRIQYETLVAMGTPAATSGDASDDLVLPDA